MPLAPKNFRHIPTKSEVANDHTINNEVNNVLSLILLDGLTLLHFLHAASVDEGGGHPTHRRVRLIEIRFLTWQQIFLIHLSVSIWLARAVDNQRVVTIS